MNQLRNDKRDDSIWQRRRVRIWAVSVLGIIIFLGLQTLFPQLQADWSLSERLTPGAMLAIFMAAMGCEFIDSTLGMGYGTTLTPLLLLVGFDPLQIVPCVLLSECVTGISAGLLHHRDGNVDLLGDRRARWTALLLSLLSVVGAVAAVALAVKVSKFWLTAIIAIIILSVGLAILATLGRQLKYRAGHIVAIGTVAAFNKGLSGGGYGPLVTAGQVVSGLSSRQAVAITSLAEGLTCAIGLAAYLLLHGRIDLLLALPLTAGAVMSVPMATLTVRKLPETFMRTSVGVTTCLLGILTAAKLFW